MANCILIYKRFVNLINLENGESSYIESRFTDIQFHTLLENLSTIDTRATTEGFWKDELDTLLANRSA